MRSPRHYRVSGARRPSWNNATAPVAPSWFPAAPWPSAKSSRRGHCWCCPRTLTAAILVPTAKTRATSPDRRGLPWRLRRWPQYPCHKGSMRRCSRARPPKEDRRCRRQPETATARATALAKPRVAKKSATVIAATATTASGTAALGATTAEASGQGVSTARASTTMPKTVHRSRANAAGPRAEATEVGAATAVTMPPIMAAAKVPEGRHRHGPTQRRRRPSTRSSSSEAILVLMHTTPPRALRSRRSR
mmetsp:Transcript_32655/g.90021  ORF Transcript_32655/g.90021 Transcript_32655/m.90021 type:complete len:249 (+) Transcript_32655:1896-2642(+)